MDVFRKLTLGFWISCGKLIGLIFVSKNKFGKFYCTKHYRVYNLAVEVVLALAFPWAYYKIIQHVNVVDGLDISFSIAVSTLKDYIDFVFMMSSLNFQRYNRNNLKELLNEVQEFAEKHQRHFQCFISGELEKLMKTFCVSIVVILMKIIAILLTTIVIVNRGEVNIVYFTIYLIPKLAMFVVSSEYFLGVLFLQSQIKMFSLMIHRVNLKLKFETPEKLTRLRLDLEACETIDKMSLMHSKLFKFYKRFSGMYQFQILLVVLSNCFSLMVEMFYVFNVSFFASQNLYSGKSFKLREMAIISTVIRCCDIYLHLKCSSATTNADAMNQKTVSSLNANQKDVRLKNCVRHMN